MPMVAARHYRVTQLRYYATNMTVSRCHGQLARASWWSGYLPSR